MKFSEVYDELDNGKCLIKISWNCGKFSNGEFVFKQQPFELKLSELEELPNIPEAIKTIFKDRNEVTKFYGDNPGEWYSTINFGGQLFRADSHNNIIVYIPSVDDLSDDDWFAV